MHMNKKHYCLTKHWNGRMLLDAERAYCSVTIMSLLWMALVGSKEKVPGLSVRLCFYFLTMALLSQILLTVPLEYVPPKTSLYLKCSSCQSICIFAVSQNMIPLLKG